MNCRLSQASDLFLLDREAQGCTTKTLATYRYTLPHFLNYLFQQGLKDPQEVTPTHLRNFLLSLRDRGLKDTTQHSHARTIKTFFNFLVAEEELEKSPMAKVKMPRLEKKILSPYSPDEVQSLLSACDRLTLTGARNYAILLTLLDTGLRAAELLSLRINSFDPDTGLTRIMGKGRKEREVRMGVKARQALRRYLILRKDYRRDDPLWAMLDFKGGATQLPLQMRGLQMMLWRLGDETNVHPCSPHRFRRTFALWCLRSGMDVFSLKLLMGHSTLSTALRYLDLNGQDVERAHKAHSPADGLLARNSDGITRCGLR